MNILLKGKLVWEDFNIMEEANGIGKEVIKQTNVTVTNNTLEIRLYWAGKGTTVIPKRGRYGALISAISVCPSKLNIYEPLLLKLVWICFSSYGLTHLYIFF